METSQARFALKKTNKNTVDASFGGNIQIHRIQFLNGFCSSIDIRIKTEDGIKRVTKMCFGTRRMGYNRCHLIEFNPPVYGSLLRFIVSPVDSFYGDGEINNLKVYRSSAIPQKALLATCELDEHFQSPNNWTLLEKVYNNKIS